MKAKATYDPEADTIEIYFAPEGVKYVESEEVAPGLALDYDAERRVIGVELLHVHKLLEEGILVAPDGAPAPKKPEPRRPSADH